MRTLLALGAAPLRAALIALGTGLVEPVGGLFGVIASTVAGAALPLALAAAAALAFCTAGFARRLGIDVAGHLIASAFVATTTVYGHMLWRAVWPRRPDPDEKDR